MSAIEGNTFLLSEAFFSIQGEGATTGYPSIFVRLKGCNLLCQGSGWVCDTIPVWKVGKKTSFDAVTDLIEENFSCWTDPRIIFTGGEPLLTHHQRDIAKFMQAWPLYKYEIETNGTRSLGENLSSLLSSDQFRAKVQFNCSPKLANSGANNEHRKLSEPFVRQFISLGSDSSVFKFVVEKESDIEELQSIADRYSLPLRQIMLMPALDSQESFHAASKFVMELAKKTGFRCCQRLHISAWNKLTGV